MIHYILYSFSFFAVSLSLLHLFRIIFQLQLPKHKSSVYLILGIYSLLATYTLSDSYNNLRSEIIADTIAIVYFSARIWIYFLIFRCINIKMALLCVVSIFIDSIFHALLIMRLTALSELHLALSSTLLQTLVYSLFIWLIKRNNMEESIAKYARKIKTYIYILAIATVGLISLLGAMATFTFDSETTINWIQICTILLLIMISVVVSNIVKIAISEQEKTELSELLTKQMENQVSYYEKINEIYDEFRSFRHDFQNHVLCLQSILDSKDVEQAQDYLSGLVNLSTVTRPKYNTGSVIIDALLNDKSATAEKHNTFIDFNGYVPTSGIHSVDLCTIFFNAIDNAVEACQKSSTQTPKVIHIQSDFRQGYYFLSISNPIFEAVHIEKGHITTSKANTFLHGYGIANIIKTVKKYNGETNISTKDENFHLNVTLLLDQSIT